MVWAETGWSVQHLATILNLELKWQQQKDQKGSAISPGDSLSTLLMNVPVALGRSWGSQVIWTSHARGCGAVRCNLGWYHQCWETFKEGGQTKTKNPQRKKKKTLEDKRREKPNHTAVRGNKKHVRMKTTSMYVNICHPQQYDPQNKGDGLPAA